MDKFMKQKNWVNQAIKAIDDCQKAYMQHLSQGPNPRFYAYQILKELVIEQLPQEEPQYEKNINHSIG